MRILSIMLGVVGGVVLVTCLLTVFFFPLDSWLLWGKVVVGSAMLLAAVVLNWQGVRALTAKRSTAYVGISVVTTAALVAALAAVNYLAAQQKFEIDLTTGRIFTLADQTEKALAGLTQEVKITAFYRKDEAEAVMLDDLIDRYRLHSDKVSLRLVDPDRKPDMVERYNVKFDSPRIVVEAGEQETRVREPSEEALTNALMEVTQTTKKRVYFIIGHGEPGIEDEDEAGYFATADDLRSEGYEVLSLNLVDIGRVPDDAGLLVLAGPRQPLLAPELEQLGDYLERGGKLLAMLEPNADPGLGALLKRYKLGYRDDTVLDESPYGRLFGVGPDAAIVFTYEDHPVVRDFENTMSVFVGSRSLRTIDEGEGTDAAVTTVPLFSSTPRSWGETDITAGGWQWDEGEAKGPVLLAAAATKNTSTVEEARKLGDELRLILVGDASFGDNRYRNLQINRDLLLNMVAWLSEQEDRISIRPKQRGASRIVLSAEQEAFIAFFAIDGLPVALLAFGLGIWLVRRRR